MIKYSRHISSPISHSKPPTRAPPPPPLSGSGASNIVVSIPGLRLDGGSDIHFHKTANTTTDPESASKPAQPRLHLKNSLSAHSLIRKARVSKMRPSRPFPRAATSPDLLSSPTGPTIPPQHEYVPNRDGAISRVDRYSRILPAPASPTPPTIVAGPSRPSGLRIVTLASDMPNIVASEESKVHTPSFSPSTSSISRKQRFKPHFGLGIARQGMQKAITSMRPPSTIGGLRLRKAATTSGSSTPITAKTMEIGAPTKVTKKTPEEIQEMLRVLGIKSEDLPPKSSGGSSINKITASVEDVKIQDAGAEVRLSEVQKGKRATRSGSIASRSLSKSFSMKRKKSQLSAKQLGKLPARSPSPLPSPSPSAAPSNVSTTDESTATLVPEPEKKPLGWYTTASLAEIRATLPKVKAEDMIPREEMPEFIAGLMRDFAVLRNVSAWRDAQLDREIEEMVEADLKKRCADEEREEEEMEDDYYDDYDDEEYIWGEWGEPNPRYVDGGWGQEEISSAGVGQRWFVFDDVENILGGPKCPLTHGGFEEEEEEDVGTNEQKNIDEAVEEVKKAQEIRLVNKEVDEQFVDAKESFDEDAHQLTQLEILQREGLV
ncbi:hypothetical protein NHQ30_004065 [Ciborinia camelliae]|nr:hypothetical protein NHQ30_004065 [Ciborinia camelliae]